MEATFAFETRYPLITLKYGVTKHNNTFRVFAAVPNKNLIISLVSDSLLCSETAELHETLTVLML
jgi:hypothetical protein